MQLFIRLRGLNFNRKLISRAAALVENSRPRGSSSEILPPPEDQQPLTPQVSLALRAAVELEESFSQAAAIITELRVKSSVVYGPSCRRMEGGHLGQGNWQCSAVY